MDPLIASLLAKFATQTVLSVLSVMENKALSDQEKQEKVAEILVKINQKAQDRSYNDYDPTLREDGG